MQKLKDLLAQIQSKILAIKGKLPFFKKSDATAAPTAPAPDSTKIVIKKDSLASIYRDGSFGTRFGILLVFGLAFIFLYSSTLLGIKIFQRIKASAGNVQIQKEVRSQFEGLNNKVAQSAAIFSIGEITAEAYKPEGNKKGIAKLEVWIRCDNPKTAAYIQTIDVKLRDKIIDSLRTLAHDEVDLMDTEGKDQGKEYIRAELNKYLEHGEILDLYFHNFVIQ